jgi:hypothetical protein
MKKPVRNETVYKAERREESTKLRLKTKRINGVKEENVCEISLKEVNNLPR